MTDEVKPPLTTTTSILPAMAVLLVAVATLVVFIAINALAGSSVKSSSTTLPVIVGGLGTAPGDPLAGCRQPDNPPANVVTALRVPASSVVTTPAAISNAGAGDFTCGATLRTAASAGKVLGYYRAQLEVRGWSLFSRAPSHGHAELLFQKGGSDGFYWVVGVTILHATASTATWTYAVYQNSSSI